LVEVTTVGGAPPTATQFVAVGHETPERVPTVHGIVCFVHDVPPFVVANTNGGDVAAAVPTAKQFAADAHDTPVKLRAAPRAGWLVHDDPPSVDTSTVWASRRRPVPWWTPRRHLSPRAPRSALSKYTKLLYTSKLLYGARLRWSKCSRRRS
jgi:hypothetical protein